MEIMALRDIFRNFFPKAAPDIRVAIDIGSMSIKTVLFEKRGQNLIIIKKMVSQYPLREEPADLIKFINSYIREELFQIIKELHRVTSKVVAGVSGDFLENSIHSIKAGRPHKNKQLTETEVGEIFMKGRDDFSSGNSDSVLIDSFPLRTLVNGYEIKDLSGDIQGDSVEILIFASYMKKAHWDQFKTIKDVLGGIPLRFVSNQFVNAFSLPKILKVSDAFFVDVGAKATEMSLVEGERIRTIHRFPIGGYHFTKIVSDALGVGYIEADNIKRQYEDQVLPASVSAKIKGAFEKGIRGWKDEFVASISSNAHFILPASVYAFGGGLYISEIQDFLKEGEWTAGVSWREKTAVSFLSAEKISHNMLDITKLSGFNEVSFLSLIYYSYVLD